MDVLLLSIELISVLVAHAVVGISSTTLRYTKKTSRVIWSVWVVLQGALLISAEYMVPGRILQFVIGFILSLIGQYVIFFATTKGILAQRVFTILTYSIFFCIFMTMYTLIKNSIGDVHPFLSMIIYIIMLFGVVFYFIRYVCSLCHAASKHITTGWAPLVVVNVVFLLTVILSSVFPNRLKSFGDPSFVTFLFISISIMSMYPVIFLCIKKMTALAYEKSNHLNTELLESQVVSQEREIASARQTRHDLRHHSQQMLSLLDAKAYDELREYLLTYTDQIERGKLQRFCENETVNNVLRVYMHKAESSNIRMDIVALAEKDLPISSHDIVTILANIVENAFNGALESNHDQPYISVNIRRMHGKFVIRCKNSCKTSFDFEEEMPVPVRGIGVNSITSTVEKYGGDCRFTAKNGEFSCVVIIEI